MHGELLGVSSFRVRSASRRPNPAHRCTWQHHVRTVELCSTGAQRPAEPAPFKRVRQEKGGAHVRTRCRTSRAKLTRRVAGPERLATAPPYRGEQAEEPERLPATGTRSASAVAAVLHENADPGRIADNALPVGRADDENLDSIGYLARVPRHHGRRRS